MATNNPVASGHASTRAGKSKAVAEVSELLAKSIFVFAIPSSHIKANDVVKMRKALPDGCTARVVKNKLMRIACKESEFEYLSEVTQGENFWVFVEGEENVQAPVKYLIGFGNDMDRSAVGWSPPFKAGVFSGAPLDAPGVLGVAKLATRQQLMQRLAYVIKSVPTRLARTINMVPTKVARAINLAFVEGRKEGDTVEPVAEVLEKMRAAAAVEKAEGPAEAAEEPTEAAEEPTEAAEEPTEAAEEPAEAAEEPAAETETPAAE